MQLQLLHQILFVAFFLAFMRKPAAAKEWTNRFSVVDSEIETIYLEARSQISSDEQHLLEEILAADEVILERQTRGIVDQILATIPGVGLSPIVGPARATQASVILAPVSPALNNNNGNVAGNLNNDNHLFSQISQVLSNSRTRNVTEIVDNALRIGTPAPIRDFVNGIVGAAYCNGVRRLLGRC